MNFGRARRERPALYYVLDENNRVVPLTETGDYKADILRWTELLEKTQRVARDELGERISVSTVFLGLDHGFGAGDPICFETMVFRKLDEPREVFGVLREYEACEQWHWRTYEEAVAQHKVIVELLRARGGADVSDYDPNTRRA